MQVIIKINFGEYKKNVNYPCLLTRGVAARSLRQGLPDSTTRFAGTTAVPVGSAVSTGVDESRCDSFAHQKSSISGDVPSE